MFKKIIITILSLILIVTMIDSTSFAADTTNSVNESFLDYVSNLHSSNVRYNVYDKTGQDITNTFNQSTYGMSDIEICNYVRDNTLMLSKYYVNDVQTISVGGTDSFVKLYQFSWSC